MKKLTLSQVEETLIGKRGTSRRERYEADIDLALLGLKIQELRKEKSLTQSELGELVGVQKSQISRLEKNAANANIQTILKIFGALGAEAKLKIEY